MFEWLRPAVLVTTQANPRYNSVLDFVFVAGAAQQWGGTSRIIVYPDDFPDDERKSDHRMVEAVFEPGGTVPAGPVVMESTAPVRDDYTTNEDYLLAMVAYLSEQVEVLRRELDELRASRN